KHCAVRIVLSGNNIHVSSLDLTALFAALVHELVKGSNIVQAVVVRAPIISLPSGKMQQVASPICDQPGGGAILLQVLVAGSYIWQLLVSSPVPTLFCSPPQIITLPSFK